MFLLQGLACSQSRPGGAVMVEDTAAGTSSFLGWQNVFLIFPQHNKTWPIERETALLRRLYKGLLPAVEQLVIKYQGVNNLDDSMSFDLVQLALLHWGSFSRVPEVHSSRCQDCPRGKQAGAAASAVCASRLQRCLSRCCLHLFQGFCCSAASLGRQTGTDGREIQGRWSLGAPLLALKMEGLHTGRERSVWTMEAS